MKERKGVTWPLYVVAVIILVLIVVGSGGVLLAKGRAAAKNQTAESYSCKLVKQISPSFAKMAGICGEETGAGEGEPVATIESLEYPGAKASGSTFEISLTLKNTGNGEGKLFWILMDRDTDTPINPVGAYYPEFSSNPIGPNDTRSWTESYEMNKDVSDIEYRLKLKSHTLYSLEDDSREFEITVTGPEGWGHCIQWNPDIYSDCSEYCSEVKDLSCENKCGSDGNKGAAVYDDIACEDLRSTHSCGENLGTVAKVKCCCR